MLRYSQPHRKPIVVGKPNKPMLDCILERHHLDPKRCLMVGDRLDTDIAFGVNGGLRTLLTLTGVNSLADAQAPDAIARPDYVVDSLGDLRTLSRNA